MSLFSCNCPFTALYTAPFHPSFLTSPSSSPSGHRRFWPSFLADNHPFPSLTILPFLSLTTFLSCWNSSLIVADYTALSSSFPADNPSRERPYYLFAEKSGLPFGDKPCYPLLLTSLLSLSCWQFCLLCLLKSLFFSCWQICPPLFLTSLLSLSCW